MEKVEMFRQFLRNFRDDHIHFFKSCDRQRASWIDGKGMSYPDRITLAFEEWEVIRKHSSNFPLLPGQYREIERLFKLVDVFDQVNNLPLSRKDYCALLDHSDWKKIQRRASEVYHVLQNI